MAELVACPECKKHLQVPDELIGQQVQCPECKHTFTATIGEDTNTNTATKASKAGDSSKPAWEKPASSSSSSSSNSGRKRGRDRDDDDDDDDGDGDEDRPRKRSRRPKNRGNYLPHRGGMILAFGIIALVVPVVGIIFGPIAWVMGNGDLQEIREGRMDPEGESMTQVGRILGMIATILFIASLVTTGVIFCLYFGFIGVMCCGLGAANQQNMRNFPPPPRKF